MLYSARNPASHVFGKYNVDNSKNLSRFSFLIGIPIFTCCLFSLGCSRFSVNAEAQSTTTPDQPAATPAASDLFIYTAKAGEPVSAVAHHFLAQSSLMLASELEAAIRQQNNLGKQVFLKKDQQIAIPTLENQPVVEHSISIPKDEEVRAIYLTGTMAGSAKGIDIVKRWHAVGGNAVVFDIKDSDGSMSIPFEHPLAPKTTHRPISNLPKYVRFLHEQKMHAIARIALFRDDNVAQNHSELAVRSRSTGQPWRENGKLVWTDTSNPKVQDYNIALAKWAATSGMDEIQFDYVRFPAEGNQKDAKFHFETAHPTWKRADVITDFLSKAYSELHAQGVLLSLDVFGVMAWQRNVDLAHTGQDIAQMAKYCDVMSPMIYPSHFFGMDGYKTPGDAPEHFIGTSMDRFEKITAGSGVVLRPWLQAFRWRTPTYSPQYILKQVSTSKEHGGIGFLFWNAGNDYSKPLAAMPTIMTHPESYLKVQPPAQTAA